MPVLNDTTGAPIGVANNPLIVSGDLQLDSAVEITNDVGNPIPVSGSVSITNPLLQGLTNTELRAFAVDVTVGNFPASQTVAGTVSIGNFPSTQQVNGTVELGATSLAALENTSVTVGNFPATQPVSGTVSIANFPTTQTVSGSVSATQSGSWTVNQSGVWNVSASQSGSWSIGINNFPATQQVSGTGTFNTTLSSGVGTAEATPLYILPKPLTNAISQVGAAAAAVTVTLPAAGAGLFHHIDAIEITLFNSAARTGSATPVTVTSTNMPTSIAWTFPSAGAIGTVDRYLKSSDRPIKSATANTATTIVCPATTGVIWRVNVLYSVGA
jgi:hypothetical protein